MASPNILVIRCRYLGDIVLLGSLLRNLRLHWPEAKISVLVEAAYAGILAINPDVDRVLTLPADEWTSPGQWMRLAGDLRAAGFTHVLDADNREKTAALVRLTGAPVRIALRIGCNAFKLGVCYTGVAHVSPEAYDRQPITESYLHLLGSVGVPVTTREVRLVPRAEDVVSARALLAAIPGPATSGGRTVLIHPGSRSPFRLWPPERFGEVCRRLRTGAGVRVVLIAGPGEEEMLRQVLVHAGKGQPFVDQPLPSAQFAALASLCDVVLCHDSGPMHIAAAVGTPVVALYGSQNATIWGPVGEGHTVLQAPLPCRDCVAPQVCVPGDAYRNYCVRRIGVDQVLAAVQATLSRR